MKRYVLLLVPGLLAAQKGQNLILDPATLLKPATDAWPTYNGDYTGNASARSQINQQTVKQLTPVWIYRAQAGPGFNTIVGGTGPTRLRWPDAKTVSADCRSKPRR